MEFTYENAAKWFENYFSAFNKNAGPLETVPEMMKFFTPDLEFWSFNMPAGSVPRPSSRDQLLMTMVHPGLHEHLEPREYIIDLKRMMVVVQFQLSFIDEVSGTKWPPKQASAHYYLVPDDNTGFKIKKIQYFTEASVPETTSPTSRELWKKYKEKALEELATNWIKSPYKTLNEIKAK
jgi:hypothetical protein